MKTTFKYKLVGTPSAKLDIKNAAIRYNAEQPGLGKKFTQQVTKKLNSVKLNPYGYAIRYQNVRTAVLDVFPFMTHYIIDDTKSTSFFLL